MAQSKKKGRGGKNKTPHRTKKKTTPSSGRMPAHGADDAELPEDEGAAGETVVFKRCPSCKRLYEDNNGHFCPSCHFDTRTYHHPPAERPRSLTLRFLPTYISTVISISLISFLLYFMIVPAPNGIKDIFSAGWLFLLLGISLLILAATFFFALKRSRITPELKSGVMLSTTLGISISSFLIGMFEPAKQLMELDNEVTWSKDTEMLHTAYLLLGFVFLVLTAILGYLVARKSTTEEPK